MLCKRKGARDIKKRLSARRRGAVLLEYTLLLCSILPLIVLVLLAIPIGLPLVFGASAMIYRSSWLGGEFGEIGEGIVHLYQRIITIISLPIP